MNIYLITQDKNYDYDTYDSAVVAANSEEEARMIHPDGRDEWNGESETYSSWCDSMYVEVDFIGTTSVREKGVICSSFNAG